MAAFRFRLQGYLNLKEKLEEQSELAYGKALAHLYREQEARRILEAERQAKLCKFREDIAKKVQPQVIRGYNNYIELLKRRIAERDKSIEKAKIAAEKRRLELVEAMKQRKIIEKLRERKREEFLQQENINEQKVLDEVISYRFN
ncbi:MAG: flagellar export protein FliJ [Clostridiales bacterium]|nr:flagellar export protein FliJ [Clostridiales bacterium]